MEATSPQGRLLIRPTVTLLATGARERPRSARKIPGDRVAGVYTTGQIQNMVHLHHHPVETADVVSLEGTHVAGRIIEYLDGTQWPGDGVQLRVEPPLRWISPSVYRPGEADPARNRLVCWIDEFITAPVVTVRQGSRQISRTRLAWSAAPGRAFRIPSKVLHGVDPRAGDITISVN